MTTSRFGSPLPRVLAPWTITRSEREPAGRAFAEQHHGTPFIQLELLVPRGAPHPQKVRLHEWYSRLGYEWIAQREFDEPLLTGPVDMRTYRKSLRAAPAT